MTSNRLSLLQIYCYGIFMGTADALPGVSGGTVALLLGFYGRLITAVTALTPARVFNVIRGYNPSMRDRARHAVSEMDLYFLLTLGLGMFTAIILIANLVTNLHESHPIQLFSFFTGMIAASALVLYRDIELSTSTHIIAGSLGFTVAFLVSGGAITLSGDGYLTIFLVGTIAISAMILPGISGSLILLLLGKYVYLSSELSKFIAGMGRILTNGSVGDALEPGVTISVFVLGGIFGLLTIARIVRAALARYREMTLAFLVSLIAGSIRAPLNNIGEQIEFLTLELMLLIVFWTSLGAVILFGLDYLVGGFNPE